MIRRHVTLKEANGTILPEYSVSITCDTCGVILDFMRLSPEAMAVYPEVQYCEPCGLKKLGLACLIRKEETA